MTKPYDANCPDCASDFDSLDRRQFLKTASAAAPATGMAPSLLHAKDSASAPESHVKKLFDTLDEKQRSVIAFDWDYTEKERGLLRTHVSNNWHITKPAIGSDFYTKDQQEIIRAIFEGVYNPDWIGNIEKQLKDDAGGYGKSQNLAIFGNPGEDKFELVMTGRHMTVRVDGNSAEHVAFGGPIFYGHAASGFNEKVGHPGNVFWPQAVEANKVYEMLDGKQRKQALIARRPSESAVGFRGKEGNFAGVSVADLSSDQKEQVQNVLKKLLEPYRKVDQAEVRQCLEAQGGLDACSLAFYQAGDIGDDGVWDNWRLEGPSFVWYYRGEPHVHVWVNVASSPDVATNAKG